MYLEKIKSKEMRGQTMTLPFIKTVLTIILAGINNRHKQHQKH